MGYADLDGIGRPVNAAVVATPWGAQVDDNFKVFAASGGLSVATSETTASTAYVDLATAGPAVTATTGANALLLVCALIYNAAQFTSEWMAVAVSGATTIAAADANALVVYSPAIGSGGAFRAAALVVFSTLVPGVNTFTAKYRTNGGTATFANRSIALIALP